MIEFLATAALLWLHPDVRFSRDRRNYDGERVTEICVGVFQRAETWACVEVARA